MGIGQCNVEFGYQLCIWSRTEENHVTPWPILSVGPSRCLLNSSQQWSVHTLLNEWDWSIVSCFSVSWSSVHINLKWHYSCIEIFPTVSSAIPSAVSCTIQVMFCPKLICCSKWRMTSTKFSYASGGRLYGRTGDVTSGAEHERTALPVGDVGTRIIDCHCDCWWKDTSEN
jgi:hypothetical protein